MASSVEQQATAGSVPSPQVVGYAFVQQYYHILHQSPELVFRFYQDSSKLGRPEDNGIMGSVSTLKAINEKIISLDYGGFSAEIKTVDAQDSHDRAVLVLVTGYLTGKDNVKRNFTQTFFLAPQDKGYFVLNDMFRYVEDANHDKNQNLAIEVDAPLTPHPEPAIVEDNHAPEQVNASTEEATREEVYNPPENVEVLAAEDEPTVPEVVDEIHDDSQLVTESDSKLEDEPKKSYASIVMKVSGTPISNTASSPPKCLPKDQQVAVPTPPAPLPVEISVVNSKAIENGNSQEAEAEGHSIYIKGLPMNATPALLDAEFKKFGPIKNNGIQVRSNPDFCFGFVEFEVASAVQSAIKMSPIMVGGRQVHVEVKRSNSRVNNRGGRFANGRGGGGFRNDGGRGRGNFGGGRGFSRGEFNNRAEFGSRNGGRGAYSNRGGDGFQRAEHAGSNGAGGGGGRMNHANGTTANGTAKNTAKRVPATTQVSN